MSVETTLDAARKRIILPLDVPTLAAASGLVKELAAYVGMFKVGHQLLHAEGTPQVTRFIHRNEGRVFVDAKLTDIDNTMAGGAASIATHEPAIFNVMANSGISAMMEAVANRGNSLVFAVTILTSLTEERCQLIYGRSCKAQVLQFARDAKLAGCDGVICSPQELEMLKKQPELAGLQYMTPGVRPKSAKSDDQARIMTPYDAILAGADYLVIGRPITNPPSGRSRTDAAAEIASDIADALRELKERAS